MARTTGHSDRPGLAAARWPRVDIAASYAASLAAFAHAIMDLYWALGGHALLSTVGDTRSAWPIHAFCFPSPRSA